MFYYPPDGRVFKNHTEIRYGFTYVLFPQVITPDMLDYLGVYELLYQEPEVEVNQIAEPSEIVQIDGQWVQQWTIRDRTPEEMPDPEPDPEPEDPPVDPDPEEPVQSGN